MATVVVIGGGPGGSTAATMLARAGHAVTLCERERFPRDHVGESLLPATMPLLEALGVSGAVASAGFLPKWGATMVWGTGSEAWSWYFRETNRTHPHAYQVWRPQFDQILLDNSRQHGVDVREGHRVERVVIDGGRAVGVELADAGGTTTRREADFVLDASGQAALLGKALGLRRWDPYFRNMAVHGYFEGAARLEPPNETNILVESYDEGWIWVIPLHTGQTSVGAVVDQDVARRGRDGTTMADLLRSQVARTTVAAELLSEATLVGAVRTVRDWSYTSERMAGAGFALVGDAACFVDPLFSSGVHLAMTGGVLGAAYAVTSLSDPELGAAAAPVYEGLYRSHYDRFHQLARLFYSSNRTVESYYWSARRILGPEAEDFSPRQAFVAAVAGQPPAGYERVVLDRGQAPSEFIEAVAEVERERQRRRSRMTLGGPPRDAVPRLAESVRVERRPILGSDRFVWGDSLITSWHPEGVPCSALVVELIRRIDGRRSVGQLLGAIAARHAAGSRSTVERDLLATISTLYVDGSIAGLSPGAP